MSLVLRIAVAGTLDGTTVPPSIPTGVKQPDGSFLISIPGSLGVLPLQQLLDALPGDEPGDVFFPRVEWAGGTTNSLNVLGPGLAAQGPSRPLVSGAVNAVFVAELGGLRFVSDGAGPFQINTNLVYAINQKDLIRAACCQADLEAGGGGGGVAVCSSIPAALAAGSAGSAGVDTDAARCDHEHPVPVAAPVAIGTANAPGASTSLVRADHVHDHGALPGGTLHAVATPVLAGFLSAADKAKIDGLSPGAGPAVLSFGSGSVAASAETRYLYPWGSSGTAPLAPISMQTSRPGVVRNLYVHVGSPSAGVNTHTYELLKNGAPTGLLVSFVQSSTGGSNTAISVPVVAGDLLSLRVTKSGPGGAPADVVANMDFAWS